MTTYGNGGETAAQPAQHPLAGRKFEEFQTFEEWKRRFDQETNAAMCEGLLYVLSHHQGLRKTPEVVSFLVSVADGHAQREGFLVDGRNVGKAGIAARACKELFERVLVTERKSVGFPTATWHWIFLGDAAVAKKLLWFMDDGDRHSYSPCRNLPFGWSADLNHLQRRMLEFTKEFAEMCWHRLPQERPRLVPILERADHVQFFQNDGHQDGPTLEALDRLALLRAREATAKIPGMRPPETVEEVAAYNDVGMIALQIRLRQKERQRQKEPTGGGSKLHWLEKDL